MADNNSVGKISLDLEIQSDIGKQISTVSNLIGKNLKNSLQSSTKAAFGSMKKNLDSNAKTLRDTFKKVISGAVEGAKSIKLPTPKFPKVNFNTPKQAETPSVAMPRAPPIPKVSSGINIEQIKAQIESLTASLNNTNARIEQQQEKLRGLREQYSSTFNPATKNKLQEQILKTEAAINKLVASSDKAGFKLADLDAKLAGAGSAAGQLGNASNKAGNQANKASNNFKLFGNSVKNTSNNLRGTHNQFNMMMRSIVTWGLIFPAIIKGITATGRFLGQAMMTNQQFANSLVQIKSNLYTAFMPIYQAVLPAINTLMSALSTATAYLASFMNTLFGKTFQQGMQSAKGLVAAKVAMGAYGEAAKKAGKDAKGALAGFDELNILNTSNDDEAGAGTGGSKVPDIVAPNLDTSALDKSTSIWAQRFKQILGTIFNPFKNAWAKDGSGVMAEFRNAVDGTKGTLNNFFNMLATPPVQLFLENVGRLILAIIKLGLRIYDSFILPIVNWFISILPGAAQGLNPIIEIVTRLVNYLAGDGFTGVQVFLAIVIGLVAGIKTFIVILEVIAWAKNLIVVLKGVWAVMMANPIVLVISIIVGLVAAFMTLWATNENFRNAMKAIWENIKNIFSSVLNWLKDSFTRDWSVIFGIFGDPINAFFVNLRSKIDAVKQIFRGLIDFIAGIFTGDWDRAWRGVLNVFGGIFNGLTAMAKSPLNGLIGLINGAITGLNKISLPSWVPGIGGMGVSIPKIPYLARGGIIDSPTLAMVGEAGKEAVMPLENNTGWIDLLADKLTQRLGGINTGGTSNSSTDRAVEIVIQLGGYEFARFIIDSINKLQRQSGRTLLEV